MALGTDITFAEVKALLSYPGQSLRGLCLSGAVNMWSRKKPVRTNGRYGTMAELEAGMVAAGFGLELTEVIHDPAAAALLAVSYVRPSGRCRLGDFRTYDHDAVAPISRYPASVTVEQGYASAVFALMVNGSSDHAIALADIPVLQEMYLALLLVSGGNSYIVTSDATIGDGAVSVTLNTSPGFASAGTWATQMVACSERSAQSGTPVGIGAAPFANATYRPLPFSHPSVNDGAFVISAAPALNIGTGYTRSSNTVWTITPSIALSRALPDYEIEIHVRGIRITRNGTSTDHMLDSFRTYHILGGTTAPHEQISSLSRSDFDAGYNGLPSLMIDDRVRMICSVSGGPANMQINYPQVIIMD